MSTKTTKQIAQETIDGLKKDDEYLLSKSNEQLLFIKIAIEKEAFKTSDKRQKEHLLLYVNQAQQVIAFNRNQAKERMEIKKIAHLLEPEQKAFQPLQTFKKFFSNLKMPWNKRQDQEK